MQNDTFNSQTDNPPAKKRPNRIALTRYLALAIYIVNGLPIMISPIGFLVAIMAFDAPGSTSKPGAYLPLTIVTSYFVVYPICVISSWQRLKKGGKSGWYIAAIPFIYTIPTIIWWA